MAMLCRTRIIVSEFSRVVSISLILRLDRVTTHLVRVSVISRIDARVILAILA
jgi:hypothetical protein